MNLAALQKTKRLKPSFKPALGLKITAEESITDEKSLGTWWAARLYEKPSGWAQFSEGNIIIKDGVANSTNGLLLAAELYVEETSYQLRFNGEHWIAIAIQQTQDKDAYLETQSFLSPDALNLRLTYEVAWSGSPAGPRSSRLINIAAVN